MYKRLRCDGHEASAGSISHDCMQRSRPKDTNDRCNPLRQAPKAKCWFNIKHKRRVRMLFMLAQVWYDTWDVWEAFGVRGASIG